MTLQDVQRTSFDETYELHHRHGNKKFVELLRQFGIDKIYPRGMSYYLYDENDVQHDDAISGFGANALGHNHPRLVMAVTDFMKSGIPHLVQSAPNPFAGHLLKELADLTPGDLERGFLSNSGTEAVEMALKTALLYTGRSIFISANLGFHGKTIGSLSVSGKDKYKKPFGPLLADCYQVPFNDINALQTMMDKHPHKVAAVILEPIQGEGGVHVPTNGYFTAVKRLCQEEGTLLILDEVQTGFGRTGEWFGCDHEGVVPDLMPLSKALGAGLVPIGATLMSDRIWCKCYGTQDNALLHTSTAGGSPLACAVALKTIQTIKDEQLVSQAKKLGEYFLTNLKEVGKKYPKQIKEVRGRGLMLGFQLQNTIASAVEFFKSGMGSEAMGITYAARLLNEERVTTAYTLNSTDTIRLQLPLITDREQIDRVVNAVRTVCGNPHSPIVNAVTSLLKSGKHSHRK